MKLKYLHYFLAVAEELSFTRAAARVHIERSPLSRAIRELESDWEAHLLCRQGGCLQLTWAGEIFRGRARRILSEVKNARAHVRAAEHGCRGQLRIGLADHLAQPQLIRLLARCREEEPCTEIRILEMNADEMRRALDLRRIDAGFTVSPEPADPGQGLRREIAWRDRFAVALPGNHPLLSLQRIPRREIARYSLLLFHPESCPGGYDLVHQWLFPLPASSPKIAGYVSGHEAMLMLTAAGFGIGIGLASQIALHRTPGVTVRPVADLPATAIFLLTSDRPPTAELSHFVTRVRQIGSGARLY
ncbi:MAG: LysR family transcriptional regulator [Candidatus Accumulibacter sp.]|jgi:DNA-binding transcriptional LysR family regulator|nr:LysR family transcriptional regulator [Accumulibacter sp.]